MRRYHYVTQEIYGFGFALLLLTGCSPSTSTLILPTAVPSDVPPQSSSLVSTTASAIATPVELPLTFFDSEQGRFQVWLPETQSIRESIESKKFLGEPTDCSVFIPRDNGVVYIIQYCDFPSALIARFTTEEILDRARDDALQDAQAKLTSEEPITFNSFPGRLITADSALRDPTVYDGTYKARIYLASTRLYLVAAYVFNENWDNRMSTVDPFLESFYIEDK